MKKLISKIARKMTGTINTDVKPSIGSAQIRTVSTVQPTIQGAKMYNNPFGR